MLNIKRSKSVDKLSTEPSPLSNHKRRNKTSISQSKHVIALYATRMSLMKKSNLVLCFSQLDLSDFTRYVECWITLGLFGTEGNCHIFGTVWLQVTSARRERDLGRRRPRKTHWVRGGMISQCEWLLFGNPHCTVAKFDVVFSWCCRMWKKKEINDCSLDATSSLTVEFGDDLESLH